MITDDGLIFLSERNSALAINNVEPATYQKALKTFAERVEVESSSRQLRIRLPVTLLDSENLNKRIYPTPLIQEVVESDDLKYRAENGYLIGAADDHPTTSYVAPINGSHLVTRVWVERINSQNYLMNEWLTMLTSKGQELKSLFESGASFGVSIRGFGITDNKQDPSQGRMVKYKYLGTDAVGDPSSQVYAGTSVPHVTLLEYVDPQNVGGDPMIENKRKAKKEEDDDEKDKDVKNQDNDDGDEKDKDGDDGKEEGGKKESTLSSDTSVGSASRRRSHDMDDSDERALRRKLESRRKERDPVLETEGVDMDDLNEIVNRRNERISKLRRESRRRGRTPVRETSHDHMYEMDRDDDDDLYEMDRDDDTYERSHYVDGDMDEMGHDGNDAEYEMTHDDDDDLYEMDRDDDTYERSHYVDGDMRERDRDDMDEMGHDGDDAEFGDDEDDLLDDLEEIFDCKIESKTHAITKLLDTLHAFDVSSVDQDRTIEANEGLISDLRDEVQKESSMKNEMIDDLRAHLKEETVHQKSVNESQGEIIDDLRSVVRSVGAPIHENKVAPAEIKEMADQLIKLNPELVNFNEELYESVSVDIVTARARKYMEGVIEAPKKSAQLFNPNIGIVRSRGENIKPRGWV